MTKCKCGNKATVGEMCAPCFRVLELTERSKGRTMRSEKLKAESMKTDGPKTIRRRRVRMKNSFSDTLHIKQGPNARKRG